MSIPGSVDKPLESMSSSLHRVLAGEGAPQPTGARIMISFTEAYILYAPITITAQQSTYTWGLERLIPLHVAHFGPQQILGFCPTLKPITADILTEFAPRWLAVLLFTLP
jgi:hypothetical protein